MPQEQKELLKNKAHAHLPAGVYSDSNMARCINMFVNGYEEGVEETIEKTIEWFYDMWNACELNCKDIEKFAEEYKKTIKKKQYETD